MAARYYTLEQRIKAFWANVLIPDDVNKCWIWQATPNKRYGYIRWDGGSGKQAAHRISWVLAYGEIPDGLWVLHKCDTPKCVNPKHLFLGTHQDNVDDMVMKNRHTKPMGEKNPRHKLSISQVAQIRARYAEGNISQKRLGKEFGISDVQVSYIVNFKSWKDK